MQNGWYPRQTLGNQNVPQEHGEDVAGSLVTMSGEIVETYYSLGYRFYKVCDWKGSKLEQVTSEQICKYEADHYRKTGKR